MKLLLNNSYNLPGRDATEVEWVSYNDEDSSSSAAGQKPSPSGRQAFSLLGARRVADSDEGEGGDEDEQKARKDKDSASKKNVSCGDYLWL